MKIYRTDKAPLAYHREIRPTKAAKTIDLFIEPSQTYQTVIGFGGAFTESATHTLSKMSSSNQSKVLHAYFDPEDGLGYTLGRMHLNSSDFSLGNYTYVKENDESLESFSIAREFNTVIPTILKAERLAGKKFSFLASPWSPPGWMKTTGQMNHGGKLKKEYYPLWAQYFIKYLDAMKKAGIHIDMISVQNEPAAVQTWDSCIYTPEEERDFIKYHLGPALKKSDHAHVKILAWDHNKDIILDRMLPIYNDPDANQYTWGAAFHWYMSEDYLNLSKLHEAYPDKHLIFTEGCIEDGPRVGSYDTGVRYIKDMIHDFNHYTEAFIDWNLFLDEQGGPNHVGNYCDAPIICDTKKDSVHLNSSFYAIKHFSKHVKPGAKRIHSSLSDEKILHIAFINPDASRTVILFNDSDVSHVVAIEGTHVECPASSILTVIKEPHV